MLLAEGGQREREEKRPMGVQAAYIVQGGLQATPPFGTEDVMGSLMRLLETVDTERGRSLLGFVIDRACQQSMRTFVHSLVETGGSTADVAALPLIMMDKVDLFMPSGVHRVHAGC